MPVKLSELLGEATEYDKKREVEMRKPRHADFGCCR